MNSIDLSILKYYKEGKELCGFEGIHNNLYKNGYLDGDLELTSKGRMFIETYPNWDEVKTFENKMYLTVKVRQEPI